jgi:ketosteroid isomerase-like protein
LKCGSSSSNRDGYPVDWAAWLACAGVAGVNPCGGLTFDSYTSPWKPPRRAKGSCWGERCSSPGGSCGLQACAEGLRKLQFGNLQLLKQTELQMSDVHKNTLVKANAAISAGDFEGFLDFCTDDTKWTFVGDQILEGKKAVREWMQQTYIEPPRFDVASLIAEHEFVVAVGEITIRDKDGTSTRSSYCDVWRFRDGKMVELKAFVAAEQKIG